jgi:hypothetical protein
VSSPCRYKTFKHDPTLCVNNLLLRAVKAAGDPSRPNLPIISKSRCIGTYTGGSKLLSLRLKHQTGHKVEALGPDVITGIDALALMDASGVLALVITNNRRLDLVLTAVSDSPQIPIRVIGIGTLPK